MHIRPATADDTDAVAAIDHAAKAAALCAVRWAHTPAEVRGWLEAVRLPSGCCWLADGNGNEEREPDMLFSWPNP